jgi:hypothetical protein
MTSLNISVLHFVLFHNDQFALSSGTLLEVYLVEYKKNFSIQFMKLHLHSTINKVKQLDKIVRMVYLCHKYETL